MIGRAFVVFTGEYLPDLFYTLIQKPLEGVAQSPAGALIMVFVMNLLWVLGIHGGMMGETCVIAILLGLAYLLFTHTIEFTIPASIVGTMYVLTLLATRDPYIALLDCMSGGLLFGAVFMATDYVTSPFTTKGKLFYGVFIGLVTFLIRNFASMNEGMSFAILLGNLMTPWFNAWGHQTPLGYKKPQKAAKGGKE